MVSLFSISLLKKAGTSLPAPESINPPIIIKIKDGINSHKEILFNRGKDIKLNSAPYRA
jgi:hypothetical protein